MNLTTKLKGWLSANCSVAETASDEEFKKAAALAIVEDKLTTKELDNLSSDGEPDIDDMIAKAVNKAIEPLAAKLAERQADTNSAVLGSVVDSALANVSAQMDEPKKSTSAMAAKVFGAGDTNVRVKSPVERYAHTKGAIVHPSDSKHAHLRGMPAMFGDTPLESQSQADKAVIGAIAKWMISSPANNGTGGRVPPAFRMTEHDRELVKYAIHELPWTGICRTNGEYSGIDNGGVEINGRKLSDFEKKVLLDDSTSGGTEAVPMVFDEAIITTPVLYGELYPLVTTVPVARGRRIQGSSISNVTWTSGTAEGMAITPFSTASMVSAFSNTIYPAVAAIEIGNDFQEDSPINIASLIVEQAGKKAMEWLDNQIANGDGTTEPQGIFNASGTTDIGNPAGGAGAAAQINDYETLYFSVSKAYRPPSDKDRTVFIGSDTTYRRARAIYVGAADARRVFGMDHQSYSILNVPFKVQNDIANNYCACCNLRYFRMYRRLGLNVRTETGGSTLALANKTLIVMRMRWAGKIELGGAVAYSDNWQA